MGWTVVATTTMAMFAAEVAMFAVETADLAAVEPHARRMPASSVLELPLCCLHQSNNHLSYRI
jgi:hypothetical protein